MCRWRHTLACCVRGGGGYGHRVQYDAPISRNNIKSVRSRSLISYVEHNYSVVALNTHLVHTRYNYLTPPTPARKRLLYCVRKLRVCCYWQAPWLNFAPCSLSNVLSSTAQYHCLDYISFPLQVYRNIGMYLYTVGTSNMGWAGNNNCY